MGASSTVDRLLKNMGNMHELGRQRTFELGNPFNFFSILFKTIHCMLGGRFLFFRCLHLVCGVCFTL